MTSTGPPTGPEVGPSRGSPARRPIGLSLARAAKTVGRAFDDALAAAGGSTPVWLILISLKTQQTANQRELAQAVGIQGATLTHHLNAMESDGLITRRRDPANRRVHQVALTERGEALFHRLAKAARAHDERLRAGLGEQEIAALEDLLARLAANVGDEARRAALRTPLVEPDGVDIAQEISTARDEER